MDVQKFYNCLDNVQEFPWKQLENIYFRDKKFSVQVHDAAGKRYVP